MKKGIVFTTDILIGSIFVVIILLVFAFYEFESIIPEKKYEKLNYVAEDTMDLMASLKANDISDKPTVSRLIDEGSLTERDLNKSSLDLIASFWYKGNKTIARNISEEVLEHITKDVCINLTVETETIYSSCSTPAEKIAVATRIESGYEPGDSPFKYIARALLTNIKGKKDSSYAFFGGYVGDGNITRSITLYSLNEVLNASMVLDAGDDFELYINGNYINTFSPTPGNLTADEWFIDASYYNLFHDGNNTLRFNFTGNKSRIGGGYFKVIYSSSQFLPTGSGGLDVYYFPGIDGIINLYSSFYVPGNLNSLEVRLHYKSNYETFFSIGNATIYGKNATGEEIDYISDTNAINNLTSYGLDYEFLSNKTIPIRMGLSNISYVSFLGGIADVFSVTDVSGSMDDCITPIYGVADCSSVPDTGCCWWWWGYRQCDRCKISEAKVANKLFVDGILNISGNRLGLVTYSTNVRDMYSLTNNNDTLKNFINTWDRTYSSGWTCICCGVNSASAELNSDSNPLRYKSIVVMTDGLANTDCSQQGVTEDLDGDDVNDTASDDAIQSACDAYDDYGIIVNTIGFGSDVNETILQLMADCGHGEYYYADVTELSEIYQKVAENILNASYVAQTVKTEGDVNNTILYSDSYIRFTYDPITIPLGYGEITLTRETNRTEDCTGYVKTDDYVEGGYYIPGEVEVIDAKVASYSSEFWTHKVDVNTTSTSWQNVYRLSDYGMDYRILGDPYIVQIPVNLIGEGENNFVRVETGINPNNATGGSPDDRVIYIMKLKGSVGYGNIFDTPTLATDDARDRLINKISSYVDVDEDDVEIQNETIGGIQGLWGPSLLKIIVWENTTI
jgi:hypothetical protein